MQKALRNQRGQSLVEYLILIALVGIGSVAVVRAVGQNVQVRFAKVVQGLGGKVDGDIQATTLSESSYKRKDLSNFLRGATDNKNKDD